MALLPGEATPFFLPNKPGDKSEKLENKSKILK
jgi:hypothetical protein